MHEYPKERNQDARIKPALIEVENKIRIISINTPLKEKTRVEREGRFAS